MNTEFHVFRINKWKNNGTVTEGDRFDQLLAHIIMVGRLYRT